MQVSDDLKEALKKVAFGFVKSVVQEDYLTAYEFEEKIKKEYGKDKKPKGESVKSLPIDGQVGIFDGANEDLALKNSSDGEVSDGETIESGQEKPLGKRKPREKDKYKMVCVKRRVDQKYYPPEVSGLKMLLELEKANEKTGVQKIVEDVKSMTMDELLEFRYRLLSDLGSEPHTDEE